MVTSTTLRRTLSTVLVGGLGLLVVSVLVVRVEVSEGAEFSHEEGEVREGGNLGVGDETSGTTADCSAFGRALGSVSDAMVSAIRGPLSAAASGVRLFVVHGLMLTGGEGVCACVCCCGN